MAVAITAPPTRPRRFTRGARNRFLWAMVFLSPWMFGLLAFVLYPMGMSFYYSLTNYNILSPAQFIGMDNYRFLLTSDQYFRSSLSNTVYLAIFGVAAQLVVGLITALLLNFKVRGLSLFRTIFFLPSIMPAVALTILFLWLLNPNLGAVNLLLQQVGITGPDWFGDPSWSKPSLILMQVWGVGGTTIIYLAGLQGISVDLYEAADLDGASSLAKLRHITLPLLSGVTLFNLVTGIIWALQFFTQAYIAGGGGNNGAPSGAPQGSLLFYSIYLYANAFSYLRMGYASAMAWILFVITMIITAVVLLSSRRWVYYEGANQ